MKAKGGLTLIEVLISSLVVAIAVMGTLGVMTATGVQNETLKTQVVATKACQETMEMLLALPYSEMVNSGSFDNIPGQPPPIVLVPNSHFRGFFQVKRPLADNQWIGEFEIRDITQNHLAELPATLRSTVGIAPADRWLAAEVIVRMNLKNIHVTLKTRRKQ